MSQSNNEQATRDVAAALADLRGRRDQAVADIDERITQLEQVGAALSRGEMDPRAAQDRVRRLIGGDRGQPVRSMRAGRTQIGMRLPAEMTPVGPPSSPGNRPPSGPTPTLATANINKALTTLDARIVAVLTAPTSELPRDEARLELGLLGRLRRSLEQQLADMPNDVVLLSTVIEYAEEILATVSDLDTGGGARLLRLLDYARELYSQVVASGGALPGVKEQLHRTRELLGGGDAKLGQATQDALTTCGRIQQEVNRRFPPTAGTLLDELLKG